jgi:protein disulfide-isomerase A4
LIIVFLLVPTLFYFRNGTKEEYSGARTALAIVDFMRERADPNWKPEAETVITLTEENFDSIVNKETLIGVEFYAPWCGHCKRLAPEWERAAKRLQTLETPIKLAKVDATNEKALAQRYDVTGYPTILLFRRGKKFKYLGSREESGIVEYFTRELIPPSKHISSLETLKKEISGDWPTILGLFESESYPLFETFIESAFLERERDFRFFHSFDPKVAKSLKENENSVVLLAAELFSSEWEPKRYRLPLDSSSVTAEDISHFIGNNSLPLVGRRSPQNEWLYRRYPLVVVYYDVDLSFEHRKRKFFSFPVYKFEKTFLQKLR